MIWRDHWQGIRRLAVTSVVVLTTACGPAVDTNAEVAQPPFQPVASVEALMHEIVYPNAEVVWDAVGTIITPEGTNEIRPDSQEEWDAVARSALEIAESGNLLMLEGRARDSGEWLERSAALIDAATLAIDAANEHDPAVLFDVGGVIYEACTACHESYWEKPPSAMRP